MKTDGELYDGTKLAGAADLRAALLTRSDVIVTHMTEMLMAYGLGRRVEYYDMPTIRKIVRDAEPAELQDDGADSRRRPESGIQNRGR